MDETEINTQQPTQRKKFATQDQSTIIKTADHQPPNEYPYISDSVRVFSLLVPIQGWGFSIAYHIVCPWVSTVHVPRHSSSVQTQQLVVASAQKAQEIPTRGVPDNRCGDGDGGQCVDHERTSFQFSDVARSIGNTCTSVHPIESLEWNISILCGQVEQLHERLLVEIWSPRHWNRGSAALSSLLVHWLCHTNI